MFSLSIFSPHKHTLDIFIVRLHGKQDKAICDARGHLKILFLLITGYMSHEIIFNARGVLNTHVKEK